MMIFHASPSDVFVVAAFVVVWMLNAALWIIEQCTDDRAETPMLGAEKNSDVSSWVKR